MFFGENIIDAHGSWCTDVPKTLQRELVHNLKILASSKSLKFSLFLISLENMTSLETSTEQ